MSCDYCWPGNCCGGPNCLSPPRPATRKPSKLELLASLPCVNSRKVAETIIAELAARGVHLAFEKELSDGERDRLIRERMADWPARDAIPR